MRLKPVLFMVAVLSLLAPARARASFHLMQIEQVIGGADGDNTIQAIQLRMRSSFQNVVAGSRMRVWDSAGGNPIVVADPAASVVNQGVGVRILIASANFVSRTTPPAVPDFIMTALIPASYLAAGSLTFENQTGTVIYWRLSWGGAGYAGPTTGEAGLLGNDLDGEFGKFSGPLPSVDTRAIRFTGAAGDASTTNSAQYALTAGNSTWVNNAGGIFTVEVLPTGIEPTPLDAPILQNFPNPFNPSTEIVFNIESAGRATLRIHDVQGRLVTTLIDREMPAGRGRAIWDARDSDGNAMATGVYFYRLVTRDAVHTRKMVLLK